MVTNTNLKYSNSSSNYYVIIMLQNLEKKNSLSGCTNCRVEANNIREAVVVCTRCLQVERTTKCSALVYLYTFVCMLRID